MQSLKELQEQMNRLGGIGEMLAELTSHIEGRKDDPKIVAATLFARAWTHYCAFGTLIKEGFVLECEIILRSSVEVAICMANVLRRPKEFLAELDADAAHTMRGQVNMMRNGSFDFVEAVAAESKEIFGEEKGKGLVWKDLAEKVKANDLYSYHKALSGTAAHVTGISLLRTLSGDTEKEFQAQLELRTVGWMCGTMLATCLDYSVILGDRDTMFELTSMIDEAAKKNGVVDDVEFNG